MTAPCGAGTQEALYAEMRGRIQEADESPPQRHHGFYYYTRTLEGAQYRVHCRRAVPSGTGPQTGKPCCLLSEIATLGAYPMFFANALEDSHWPQRGHRCIVGLDGLGVRSY
jgi:Prolyl oligopeptidase, N-terminal beta-propeller domain